ncbi:hypothetical protein HUA74_17225 [Myxococcus sp. CA051A]|uniref:Uncharacterized protein n=1 Tax=Myxococcus llanfairpwllgwyngyllgogerychwyrndrobwllllantysiliogogogochensis TaxID=2590453 RepID=A0A540X996_9BACT|nr:MULTISPECIES: hypothetical protein [Myxococcus]NTX06911.1 hypothetical protein [Myxococcus sp. CA040A]NTX13779.1 hypothetical protein [Myxococcus sp. CA056]NTX38540.1 hypothetical protein [Myxococcus sp. CA033]NTX54791.1 hypothetical protein [Myxococcus sp. CA039A]NTX62397.1 hypothetical protein [Myxococcus sp. CA051A]
MNGKEKQGMNGVLTLELLNLDGSLMERRRVPNLITTAGKRLVAELLMGRVNGLPVKWSIVVGTGTEAPVPGDTVLKGPAAEAEDPAPKVEVIDPGDGSSLVRALVTATLPAITDATVQPLTEAGIQVTLGETTKILFNRVRFEEVNRGSNMVMKMMWEISF